MAINFLGVKCILGDYKHFYKYVVDILCLLKEDKLIFKI